MPFVSRHGPNYDRRKAYEQRLHEQGRNTHGQPFVNKFAQGLDKLIPVGPARELLYEWRELGIPVVFYLQMRGEGKDSPPGTWMIRVGDRELSVEEYLDLF